MSTGMAEPAEETRYSEWSDPGNLWILAWLSLSYPQKGQSHGKGPGPVSLCPCCTQTHLPCIAKENEQVELGKHSVDCSHSKQPVLAKLFLSVRPRWPLPARGHWIAQVGKGPSYDKGPSYSKELGQRSIYVPAGPRLSSPTSKHHRGEAPVEKSHYACPHGRFLGSRA